MGTGTEPPKDEKRRYLDERQLKKLKQDKQNGKS